METIAEECEFSDSELMEAGKWTFWTLMLFFLEGTSQSHEKPPNDRILQAKSRRKQRKDIVAKIRQKLQKTKTEEPPKWICSVKGINYCWF